MTQKTNNYAPVKLVFDQRKVLDMVLLNKAYFKYAVNISYLLDLINNSD